VGGTTGASVWVSYKCPSFDTMSELASTAPETWLGGTALKIGLVALHWPWRGANLYSPS
jgi:hypothetical protein